jgi:sialidase-1
MPSKRRSFCERNVKPGIHSHIVLLLLSVGTVSTLQGSSGSGKAPPVVTKIKDIVIYRDDQFYSAFPSIVRRRDGELLVAFRRAPERRRLGEKTYSHADPNSQLVLVRSRDSGKTWSPEPELMFANPFGGSQDPCMVQLRDGTIVCTTYSWALLPSDFAAKLSDTMHQGSFAFLGGYVLRSGDGGHSWEGPFRPPHIAPDATLDVFEKPAAAYNRGAMCEGRDGRLYWVVAANTRMQPRRTETHLLISSDQGVSWRYSCPVATDSKVTFNETSLYETPKGDLVAFLRTADFDDHTVVARSLNRGKSFQPWQDAGFQGHPHYALGLPDKQVLLVYGYRHAPFGIRARVLDAECTNYAAAAEIVLRDDGGNGDLGYPWATMISKKRVLVVYYFNLGDGTRHIAGTVLEIGR